MNGSRFQNDWFQKVVATANDGQQMTTEHDVTWRQVTDVIRQVAPLAGGI